MQINRKEIIISTISVNPLCEADVPHLVPILYESIIDRDTGIPEEVEIADVQRYMHGEPDKQGRLRTYLVARDLSGSPLGCMAVTEPEKSMLTHFYTTPAYSEELVNAFIAQSARGQGIGKKLFASICDLSRSRGKKQLILNSGPRYEFTAWEFYNKVASPFKPMLNQYGPGRHAQTWLIKL